MTEHLIVYLENQDDMLSNDTTSHQLQIAVPLATNELPTCY